jgi:hypothetical protein
MTPQEFVHKWRPSQLRERQASQEHFIDLCRLLEEPTPVEADSKGDSYCFDYGASKTGGEDGFADVWKKGCFGWEYKGKHKDLIAAYKQATEGLRRRLAEPSAIDRIGHGQDRDPHEFHEHGPGSSHHNAR